MNEIASKPPLDLLVEEYQRHLIEVAGLQPSTCGKWTFFVRLFLKAQFKPSTPVRELCGLDPERLLNFVLAQSRHYRP